MKHYEHARTLRCMLKLQHADRRQGPVRASLSACRSTRRPVCVSLPLLC
jgi:hypothetical protein